MTPTVAGRRFVEVLLVVLLIGLAVWQGPNRIETFLGIALLSAFVAAMAALVSAATRKRDPDGTSVVYPPMPAAEPLGTLPPSSALGEEKRSPACPACKSINHANRIFCQSCGAPMAGSAS